MLAVTSAKPGALARMTVVPCPTAVTLKPMTWLEALNAIKFGTMATDGLDEVSVKFVFGCAGPESVRVSVASEPGPARIMLDGAREAVSPTVIKLVAEARPGPTAVMVVVPKPTPFNVTEREGVVCPALNVTPGVMVAFEGSLLKSSTYVVVAAGRARTIGKSTVVLGGMVIAAGMTISPEVAEVTVILAVAFVSPAKLAVITLEPAATAVTGTVTVVAPAVIVTEAGTVAFAVLDELKVKVSPPVGAGAERFSERFCEPGAAMERFAGEKLMVAVTVTDCEPVV